MRIVITGASGNVGTALLRRLSRDSEHQLIGVSRRRPPVHPPYDAAIWHQIDLSRASAAEALLPILEGADAVVHLAWQIQPAHDREQLIRTNQGGTRAVVDAVRRANVPHLVHMSSVGTYAAGDWADESWSTSGVPTSSYSVDKSVAEQIVDKLDNVVTKVRPSFVLQPDAASEIARYFIGPLVPLPLLRDELFKFAPWPKEIAIQVVHADDVAEALWLILTKTFPGPVNLAAEPVIDRDQWHRIWGGVGPPAPRALLRPAADFAFRLHLQPTEAGFLDLAFAVPKLVTTRAREDLGWTPTHRGDDTLREFVVALRNRRGYQGPLLHGRKVVHHVAQGADGR